MIQRACDTPLSHFHVVGQVMTTLLIAVALIGLASTWFGRLAMAIVTWIMLSIAVAVVLHKVMHFEVATCIGLTGVFALCSFGFVLDWFKSSAQ